MSRAVSGQFALLYNGSPRAEVMASDVPVLTAPPLRPLAALLAVRALRRPVAVLKGLRRLGPRRTAALLALQDTVAACGFLISASHAADDGLARALSRPSRVRARQPDRRISGAVLTRNSAATLPRLLPWLDSLATGEVIAVDDDSSDGTPALLSSAGVRTVTRSLDGNFASQRNAALEAATRPWTLFCDSDEEPMAALGPALLRALANAPRKCDAVLVSRLNYLDGVLMEQFWPDMQVRLHATRLRYHGRVHEQVRWRRPVVLPLNGPYLLHHKTAASMAASHELYQRIDGEVL